MVPRRALPALCCALALIARAVAHRHGQEYTYLSMFLRPDATSPRGGDDNLEQVYRQFSLHQRLPPTPPPLRTARRQLHSNADERDPDEPEDPEPDEEHDAEPDAGLDAVDESDAAEPPAAHSHSDASATVRVQVPPMPPSEQDRPEHSPAEQSAEQSAEQIAGRFGEDVPRLMKMLSKLIAQYDIKSMADVPCRAHSHWMPQMLDTIAEKNENFKYVCVDTNNLILNAVKERVGMTVQSSFVKKKFWKESLPTVDLVFSWAGLDNMKEQNVLRYLQKLSKSGNKHKLIMLGNHAGSLAKKGDMDKIARFTADGKPLNFRRKPFNMVKPMRMIRDLGVDGNDKQLYLYKPSQMFPKRK
ncbi:unnamed protein product [Agarophyton chilense]